jgi:hypothetical protein
MIGDVLFKGVSSKKKKTGGLFVVARAHQFHQLKDIETLTNDSNRLDLTPTSSRRTGLGHFHHRFDSAIPHRRTMAFERLANDPKEPRGIKDGVEQFLLDELGIKDGAEIGRLLGVDLHLRLERVRMDVNAGHAR